MCGPPPFFILKKHTHYSHLHIHTSRLAPEPHSSQQNYKSPRQKKTETDLALTVCHSSPLDKVATSDPYHTQAHAPPLTKEGN